MPSKLSASPWSPARLAGELAVALALLTVVPQQLRAQSDPSADLLARIRALGIPSATDRITVYFDEGYEAKATRLRALVQDAFQFFADSLGVSAELSIAVLGPANWERVITAQPYGIPGVAGSPSVAFLPATDDNLAANDAISLEAGISDSARRLVAAAGRSWEDASRRYVDLVGLHELGHVLAGTYGISVRSMWFNEWLASYFCYSFLRAARPADARMWEGILQGYTDAVRPEHRTIDAFERLYFGVGALNYVWYQARFQQSIVKVHDAKGVDMLRQLRDAFPVGATPVASQAELIHRLEEIAPGFAAWSASMK